MTRITIDRVSKRFDKQAVLQDLSLVIEDGSLFTLLGPSGCGKTTLLRCIAGFNQPDGGRILFDDEDMTPVPAHERNIGMVFQDYALFPDKTVFDNVAYGLRARRLARDEVQSRAEQALQQVDLQAFAARFPAQLSGGQRQRVALARALVVKPRVLLMDEPLSNLDAKLRLSMRDLILDLQRATRITTVFVTHDQEEALALSRHIAVMQLGRVAQQGTPQSLYAMPRSAYVADFIGSANLLPVTVTAPGRVALGEQALEVDTAAIPVAAAAQLVLRPEALQLLSAAAAVDADNLVQARVARRQYLGAKTSYRLALAGGQAQFIGPHNAYVGTNVHVMVLMVNERQLKSLASPKTWSDLMKPEWKGKVVITGPARSGTAFIQVYGLLKQFGREGLERMARNAVVVQSSGQVYKSVAAGEYPVGITIESSAFECVAGGQKEIKLVYPAEGTYLGPEGMFIIKGAKNMALARQFYDVLLSKEAQETLLRENFRRPTRSDIAVAKLTTMPDLASLKVFPLNLQVATDEYEQLIALWNLALAKARQN